MMAARENGALAGRHRAAAPRAQAPRYMFQPRRRSSFWRRVRQILLGTPEPVLEDSL